MAANALVAQYDANNDSVLTGLNTTDNNSDNEESVDLSQSGRTSCIKRHKKVMFFTITGGIVLGVFVIVTCTTIAKHDGDGISNIHTQGGGVPGPQSLTDTRETVDPYRHLTRCDAEPTLVCHDKAVPYRGNQLEVNENASYWERLHNSSCLLCNGKCYHRENLTRRTQNLLPCAGGFIPIKSCSFRRDMINMDNGVCGGAGKYVCYSEDADPECQCDNNYKLGERCDEDFKVACRCFQTKSPLDCGERYTDCTGEKEPGWDHCTVSYLHQDLKCVCSKGIEDETLQDCSKAQTDAQTGAKGKKGTNCGSTVQGSMGVIVGGFVLITHIYFNV